MDLMGWTMVFKISQSSKIPAFLAMQVMDQANQMQAAGGDLVHLEVGRHHHRHQQQYAGPEASRHINHMGIPLQWVIRLRQRIAGIRIGINYRQIVKVANTWIISS